MNLNKNIPVEVVITKPFYRQPTRFRVEQNEELVLEVDLINLFEQMVGHRTVSHKMGLTSFLDGLCATGYEVEVVEVKRMHDRINEYRGNPDIADPIFYLMGFALGRNKLGDLIEEMQELDDLKVPTLRKTGEKYRSYPNTKTFKLAQLKRRIKSDN